MGVILGISVLEIALLVTIIITKGAYSIGLNNIYALMLHSFTIKWSSDLLIISSLVTLFLMYMIKMNKDEKRIALPTFVYIWEGLVFILLIFSVL